MEAEPPVTRVCATCFWWSQQVYGAEHGLCTDGPPVRETCAMDEGCSAWHIFRADLECRKPVEVAL